MTLHRLALLGAAVALQGCATQQPQWLLELQAIQCKAQVSSQCVKSITDEQLKTQQSAPFLYTAALHQGTAAMSKGAAWSAPSSLSERQQSQVRQLTEAISSGATSSTATAISKANAIEDQQARDLALYYLVSEDMRKDRKPSPEALEELLNTNDQLYREAMCVRLQQLLLAGDIERAFALRKHLLQTIPQGSENAAADINDIALVYIRTGMIGDMQDWVRSVGNQVPGVNRGDEALLRQLMVNAATGNPPRLEDLDGYARQEYRFVTYLELVRLYKVLGNRELELKAVQDAALISQMATLKMDREIATEMLARIWKESSI
ncbi:TPA: hypothetical protein NIA45_004583 [Pseudomonas aeruginosa]|nr:hypothetical protein [Pseudomonas aeruginosa]